MGGENNWIRMIDQKKILVVDDNETNLDLVSRILKIEGYEVITATSGMDALEQLTSIIPDMIILDHMMPNMDGCELCLNLKTLERASRIPIIMLTASSDLADRHKAQEAGVDAVISKPFDMETLQKLIHKLLNE